MKHGRGLKDVWKIPTKQVRSWVSFCTRLLERWLFQTAMGWRGQASSFLLLGLSLAMAPFVHAVFWVWRRFVTFQVQMSAQDWYINRDQYFSLKRICSCWRQKQIWTVSIACLFFFFFFGWVLNAMQTWV